MSSARGGFLPPGATLFFRQRAMELLGIGAIVLGMAGLIALITYHATDPSLNRATGFAPRNMLGFPGAAFADLMMQGIGLGAFLLPVGAIAWGVMLARHHVLHFFGLRLALLLAAVLLASTAAGRLTDIGQWTPHAGPGGVTGAALAKYVAEIVLTYSDGGPLAVVAPLATLLALALMVPVMGMRRGHLPFIFRVLVLPLQLLRWLWRAAVALWRGRPDRLDEHAPPPGPPVGYATIPGEIDASQYDPARFQPIPDEDRPLPPRDTLMVDAPLSPIAEMKHPDGEVATIPEIDHGQRRREHGWLPGWLRRRAQPTPDEYEGIGVAEERIEPVLMRAAEGEGGAPLPDDSPPPAVEPPPAVVPLGAKVLHLVRKPTPAPVVEPDDDQAPPVAPVYQPKVVLKPVKPLPGKRAQAERQHELALGGENFTLPPLDILSPPPRSLAAATIDEEALAQNARLLESVLDDFGVKGEVVKVRPGPVVTLYELEPAPGIKSSRIIGLADDIARSMSAVSVRVATVPGRNVIGIELPNVKREMVFLRELLSTKDYEDQRLNLPLVLGKDIGGGPVVADLARMPHLLIGGTTGSGKSVGINTMILSLLYRLAPDTCKFIMIDPKMLELSVYQDIPHLLTPVVTDPRKAVVALKWTVREMERRYQLMSQLGVRNIAGFNERVGEARDSGEVLTRRVQTGIDPDTREKIWEDEPIDLVSLPYIVVIIDEMADLMLVAGKDIEIAVQRLAQMARAAGIHVVMATQRPSVDVITGTIKANFPTRIAFQVTSKIDSRTILGEQGGEQLLGQGDMLYMAGGGRIVRVHGPFVSDAEVEKVVKHLRKQGKPAYIDSITEDAEGGIGGGEGSGGGSGGEAEEGSDELYDRAIDIVARERKCSTSFIQRHLQIGYNRAARIVERMEREGVVTPANSVGKREVLARDIDRDD
ncbi:MAG: DNA translocase FtsK 4TM domain-containing protein [Alphaproteobacteria bacterium]|nr:DNA translocase FtsK 4TM domain-containing protein [Alphaproteobacteria bacterium]MCW5741043.1 DNA translocase FtsK 4TM domain-containing protein [Alphaproteobacteria bacterium]